MQPPFATLTSQNGITIRILAGPPERPASMSNLWWNISGSCWRLEPTVRPTALALVNEIETVSMWMNNYTGL